MAVAEAEAGEFIRDERGQVLGGAKEILVLELGG
jgi:hypothetical protein